MTMINLIVCLSIIFVTNVSGNMFSPFSSFPGFQSFPNANPFGSSFGSSPFETSYNPFSQSYGSPFSSSAADSMSPFASSFSPSPFGYPSQGSFGFPPMPSIPPMPSFPQFPSLPSFSDLVNGLTSGLPTGGNGVMVSSASGGSSSKGKPGQVIQTIKVEKIGSSNPGPGQESRFMQTISASGPVISSPNSKSQEPNKNGGSNWNKQRPFSPTTTSIVPPNGFKINGTQSIAPNSSAGINRPATSSQLIAGSSSSSSSNGNNMGVDKPSAQAISSAINGAGGNVNNINSLNKTNSINPSTSTLNVGGVMMKRIRS